MRGAGRSSWGARHRRQASLRGVPLSGDARLAATVRRPSRMRCHWRHAARRAGGLRGVGAAHGRAAPVPSRTTIARSRRSPPRGAFVSNTEAQQRGGVTSRCASEVGRRDVHEASTKRRSAARGASARSRRLAAPECRKAPRTGPRLSASQPSSRVTPTARSWGPTPAAALRSSTRCGNAGLKRGGGQAQPSHRASPSSRRSRPPYSSDLVRNRVGSRTEPCPGCPPARRRTGVPPAPHRTMFAKLWTAVTGCGGLAATQPPGAVTEIRP